MVYPALLPLTLTPRLPVVGWTDAPADLNGFARFAEKEIWFLRVCHCISTGLYLGRERRANERIRLVEFWSARQCCEVIVVEQPIGWLTELNASANYLGSGTKLGIQLCGELSCSWVPATWLELLFGPSVWRVGVTCSVSEVRTCHFVTLVKCIECYILMGTQLCLCTDGKQ